MPEKLNGLSPKQLKLRKVIANKFTHGLLDEANKVENYIDKIDTLLTTDPQIQIKPFEERTVPELQELQCVLNQVLLRVKGIETDYRKELEKIDALIIQKR